MAHQPRLATIPLSLAALVHFSLQSRSPRDSAARRATVPTWKSRSLQTTSRVRKQKKKKVGIKQSKAIFEAAFLKDFNPLSNTFIPLRPNRLNKEKALFPGHFSHAGGLGGLVPVDHGGPADAGGVRGGAGGQRVLRRRLRQAEGAEGVPPPPTQSRHLRHGKTQWYYY